MAEIMVTASELRRKAEELRGINGQFKNSVSSLESTEGSLNGMWEGEAHDLFHKAFMEDKGQMIAFATLIEEYCNALEQIAQEYEEKERINAEIARNRTR